ncbi:PAS domain-containing protein [Caballeronia sp. dw_276]|uniref:PAS domain-containing protein n=1 Tax=Caballeronia sp. dw_276 TaxID=2719795 RepID=UPI001BD602E2|nr:PAS domain-containing protein [Caballeronia sp. dw_276]
MTKVLSLDGSEFLQGGGKVGELMRSRQWENTPHGAPRTWPQALRLTVGMCINSPLLSTVLWGPQLCMFYNDAYSVSLADRHPAALGKPVAEVWDAAWDVVAPDFHQAMQDGTGFENKNVQLRFVRNGVLETTWWDFSATPIRDETGAIVGLYNVGVETTAQVRLNETLEQRVLERTAERDRLWELTDDLLVSADYEGRIYRASNAWSRLLGYTEEELTSRPYAELTHPEDIGASMDALLKMRASGTPVQFQNRLIASDGTLRWVSWKLAPEPNNERMIGTGRDITEEMEREIALRDSMDFARLALSAVSGVGAWTYDVASDKFFCDEAISEVYGIDAKQAAKGIKREWFLANVHPDDLKALGATMSGGLLRSGDLELEYRINHPDGSVRSVLSRGHTYFDLDGVPLRRTGIGIDMTQQRLLEQQLRQSQKMEAVGQLTGGLAHDFNNMLQGILGPLELIQRLVSMRRTDGLDRYCSMAMSSAQKAAALTHRLLAFSRRQPLDPKPVDANELVASLEDLLTRTTGEMVDVVLALDEAPCKTICDANQLESALLNLSINARDAMPDGGTLTIATSHESIDESYAAAQRELKPGRFICIAVTDSGEGMPPDVARQAFDPFFTTKPLGQGTGLGLSMVYGFAGQSGGFASISSQLGQGTTIRLYLPETDRDDDSDNALAPSALLHESSGETILVVEDEDDVRSLLVEVFSDAGYSVLQATDGPSGLDILRSSVRIDLLVSDVGLPRMNGRQMADAAKLLRPHLRILFMTGYAEMAVAPGGFLGEGMQMITKPFSIEAIVNRVQGLLGA